MAATILTQNDLIKVINSSTATVDVLFKSITHIIRCCNSITPSMILKSTMVLKSLPLMLKHMQMTMTEFINSLGEDYFDQKIQKSILNNIKTISDIYNNVFDLIQKIMGTNFLKLIISFKMLRLSGPTVLKGLEVFSKIVDKITQTVSSIKSNKLTGAEKSLRAIKTIINNIAIIITALILLLPLIALFLIASPVIILCLWLFGLVIRIITNIILKAINIKTITGLVLLTSVIGIIMLIALMLVAMAYIANDIGKIILNTLKLLLGIVAVALAVVLLGWLLGTGFKFLLIAMGGLLLLATLIGIVFIVAVMLYILQFVRFDKEKVKAAVENIMECVAAIIEALFYGFSSVGGGKKGDPWYMQILTFAGGTIKTLATAIMSIRSLALMVISIVLIGIVGLILKGLQYLDLDKEKVKANVANILECVFAVIDALFNGMGGIDESAKNKPWYQTVLSFMGGIIKTLVVPMMALRFLPQVLVSIGLLQILARQLKDIQKLKDINSKAIQTNIKDIMGAAMSVMMAILFPVGIPTQKDTKGKSWFKTVIEYMAGPVALLLGPIMALQIFGQLIISIGLLQLLARQLRDLQTLTLDKDLVKDNISKVMETALFVLESIWDTTTEGKKEGGSSSWFGTVLEYMGGFVYQLIVPLLAIGYLARMIVVIGLLQLLTRQLNDIQNFELDTAALNKKITDIMSSANAVISSVYNADNKPTVQKKEGKVKALLRYILPDGLIDLCDALLAIGKIGLAMAAVGAVKILTDNLNTVCNFKFNARQTRRKVSDILLSAEALIDHIYLYSTEDIEDKADSVEDYLDCMEDALDEFGDLTKSILKLAKMKEDDVRRSMNNMSIITYNMVYILEDLARCRAGVWSVDKRTSQLKELYKVIRDFNNMTPDQIKNSEAISKNYIALLDKIGTTDIEKLKTTVNLFEKMAEFSKSINGNFEGLADALNEKIAPLLEKIQNGMDGLKSSVEQSSADVSSSVYAASQGTLSDEEMKKQVGRENPQASEKDKNDMAMRRMQQQIAKQNSELASNIDELISLFRNGSARVTLN